MPLWDGHLLGSSNESTTRTFTQEEYQYESDDQLEMCWFWFYMHVRAAVFAFFDSCVSSSQRTNSSSIEMRWNSRFRSFRTICSRYRFRNDEFSWIDGEVYFYGICFNVFAVLWLQYLQIMTTIEVVFKLAGGSELCVSSLRVFVCMPLLCTCRFDFCLRWRLEIWPSYICGVSFRFCLVFFSASAFDLSLGFCLHDRGMSWL